MTVLVDALRALSPDAQLILMMSLFALILLVATSRGPTPRSAAENIRDLLKTIGSLFHKRAE